jgi:hypothetical protein
LAADRGHEAGDEGRVACIAVHANGIVGALGYGLIQDLARAERADGERAYPATQGLLEADGFVDGVVITLVDDGRGTGVLESRPGRAFADTWCLALDGLYAD